VAFVALKIRRLRPGSNPRSCVPEASMLTTRPPQLRGKVKVTRKKPDGPDGSRGIALLFHDLGFRRGG
jgi:hypothetical protein